MISTDKSTNISKIELTDTELKRLMYEDEAYCRVRIRSRLISTDFRPMVKGLDLGKKLAQLDPNRTIWRVHFYPPDDNSPSGHSEIWLEKEWQESNTKRFMDQARSAEARMCATVISDKATFILEHFTKTLKLPDGKATRELAKALAIQPNDDLYKQFQFPTELITKLNEYQAMKKG